MKSTIASLVILLHVSTEPVKTMCVASVEIITGFGRGMEAHVDEEQDEN